MESSRAEARYPREEEHWEMKTNMKHLLFTINS